MPIKFQRIIFENTMQANFKIKIQNFVGILLRNWFQIQTQDLRIFIKYRISVSTKYLRQKN